MEFLSLRDEVHVTCKWQTGTNVLEWFRAFRNNFRWFICTSRKTKSKQISRWGDLWWDSYTESLHFFCFLSLFLSTAWLWNSSMFIFTITRKFSYMIGSASDNFNFYLFKMNFLNQNQIHASWRSDRPATPSDSSTLYSMQSTIPWKFRWWPMYYQDEILPTWKEKLDESNLRWLNPWLVLNLVFIPFPL